MTCVSVNTPGYENYILAPMARDVGVASGDTSLSLKPLPSLTTHHVMQCSNGVYKYTLVTGKVAGPRVNTVDEFCWSS